MKQNEPYTSTIDDVIARESEHIGKSSSSIKAALAFSGGGIRSASFGMGFIQALVSDNKLRLMDYLSTVSGGGYLGSSLSYFLSQKQKDGQPYGTTGADFPFGKIGEGSKIGKQNAILDFIRQHGNYLLPNSGLNLLSLIATTIRVMLVSFFVYFSLLTVFFSVVLYLFDGALTACLYAAVALVSLYIVSSLLFSFITFFNTPKYRLAVYLQRWQGFLFQSSIVLIVFGLLPIAHQYVHELPNAILAIFSDTEMSKTSAGSSVSMVSAILGAIIAIISHVRQVRASNGGSSTSSIIIAVVLLLFGIIYGAYVASLMLKDASFVYIIVLTAIVLPVALLCNINLFGLGRMYRDRLMETFMPERKSILSGTWSYATTADKTMVEDICKAPNNRPYHLINCNIVLSNSRNPKYRGRMGDSFTISPLYCGSDATGWRRTTHYLRNLFRGGITLPTAMAISGAAANPNAGVAGAGITTNRMVSTLMSLLNLRLGFWADNPNRGRSYLPPNYIYPGIKGGILGTGLNENDRVVELTDGGHFENLALYELFRRRIDLIVVSDAGADEFYEFSDLGNAIEKARVDFGINIKFESDFPLDDVVPHNRDSHAGEIPIANRGFAIAKIYYPADATHDQSEKVGTLVYVKPTLLQEVSADVLAYKRANPTFPHQTTANQFFNERQFESYRELGYYLGWNMLEERHVQSLFKNLEP